MFVTTFYSYKGGVGRTMALANVAAILADLGRRVLIVDFDLEAPGIPSYSPFEAARGQPGLVDYIHEFMETNSSPNFDRYVVECDIGDERSVWVMPAGDNSLPHYSERFATIDWGYLYEERSGYLMIEDLKAQWATFQRQGFDYVLVDSRTGHTDISGICTRQLPDLVVMMFMPTLQNVAGLAPLVDLIRSEPERGGKSIDIVFCPSNLPDLHDEDGLLGVALETARQTLGYGEGDKLEPPVVTIAHWANLALLDLPVIALSREKSRLASDYRRLAEAVMAENCADRDGGIALLKKLPEKFEAAREANFNQLSNQILNRTMDIFRCHSTDPEVALLAADVFGEAQDYQTEERLLSIAIEGDHADPRPYLLRAVARINLGEKRGSLEDVLAVLKSRDASTFDYMPAARLLQTVSDDPAKIAEEIFTDFTTRPRAKLEVAPYLMRNRENLNSVADNLVGDLQRNDLSSDLISDIINVASIALIGARRYAEAIEIIERVLADDPEHLASKFNLFVAKWGESGQPSSELLEELKVRFSDVTGRGGNMHQCAALTFGACGSDEEALSHIRSARDRLSFGFFTFSCWTYLYRDSDAFKKDLDEMENVLASREHVIPPFMSIQTKRDLASN